MRFTVSPSRMFLRVGVDARRIPALCCNLIIFIVCKLGPSAEQGFFCVQSHWPHARPLNVIQQNKRVSPLMPRKNL